METSLSGLCLKTGTKEGVVLNTLFCNNALFIHLQIIRGYSP